MLYREAGQFKSTYAADAAILPDRKDLLILRVGDLELARFPIKHARPR